MHIGSAIRLVRKKANLSQGILAEKCGMSGTALSQVEVGIKKPSKRTVLKICTALEIPEFVIYMLAIQETDIDMAKIREYRVVYPVIQNLLLQIVMPAGYFHLNDLE